jgi:hypothetical protein
LVTLHTAHLQGYVAERLIVETLEKAGFSVAKVSVAIQILQMKDLIHEEDLGCDVPPAYANYRATDKSIAYTYENWDASIK